MKLCLALVSWCACALRYNLLVLAKLLHYTRHTLVYASLLIIKMHVHWLSLQSTVLLWIPPLLRNVYISVSGAFLSLSLSHALIINLVLYSTIQLSWTSMARKIRLFPWKVTVLPVMISVHPCAMLTVNSLSLSLSLFSSHNLWHIFINLSACVMMAVCVTYFRWRAQDLQNHCEDSSWRTRESY